VLDDHDLSATALAVYVAICRAATEGEGWAPRKRLAELAGCKIRVVSDALRELEDAALVETVPRFGDDGRQLANGYRLADLDTPPLQNMQPPPASDADEEDTGEEDNPPPPARAMENEIVDNPPPPDEDDTPPCTADDFEGAFRWMGAVDDEDKAATARQLASIVQGRLFDPIHEADHTELVDAAVTAAFPNAELTAFQRDHLHRTLTDVDGGSRWQWIVGAVAVAAVLGLEATRIPSVLSGWKSAKARPQGDGHDGDPPTIEDDRAADRPTTLEEAREWAVENGFSKRVGTGVWKTVGCRGWEMSGTLGPQGETIDNLAGWARANENALLLAARGASSAH